MADRIRLLPDIVANQIKAGEVVESPSSVVKEMVENAIDAGASCVKVNFRNGGRDLIQIVDNGCGMSPTDARMAFELHATSKIESLDDIYALHTFGFRGEALASIAAVSQVELRTRQVDQEIGTLTVLNGGEFVSQTPIATPIGSQFIVRNIFYNTPARRKFINNNEAKLTSSIKTEFRRVALCHPEVELHLLSNDSPLFILPKSNLSERIIGVMGSSVKNNLLEVRVNTSIATIEGFIGRPSAAKLRGGEQYMFVNGRFFKSPYLNKAILRGYEKLIPAGTQPSFFIYIKVDADRVDVNVHAQKTEVKFADAEAIWQILNAAVRETLAKSGSVPMLDFDNESDIEIPIADHNGTIYSEPRSTSNSNYNPFASNNITAGLSPLAQSINTDFDKANISDDFDIVASGTGVYTKDIFQSHNPAPILGKEEDDEFEIIESDDSLQQELTLEGMGVTQSQTLLYGRRYAIVVRNGRCFVVDLIRARERLLYDSYHAMIGIGQAVSQKLLFPEQLTVANDEYEIMEEYAVDFAALGFEFEYLGDGNIEMNGVPADIDSSRADEIIYEMIQTLRTPDSVEEHRREALAMVLARNAARTKATFSQIEADTIVERLFSSSQSDFAPSGLPITAEITSEEITKKLN